MNIVLIDDDTGVLRSLEILLEEAGHHVMAFSDPHTACLYFEQKPEIDELILDYCMPSMNAEDVLRAIEGYLPRECKTFILTGHMEEVESSRLLRALGVDRILAKPLDISELCHLFTHSGGP